MFQNAGVYALKQSIDAHVRIYTPYEFSACYFHCDEIHELQNLPYTNYSEISNYRFPNFEKANPSTWVNPQVLNYIFERFQQLLSAKFFHGLPKFLQSDYKQRKFLFRSGIYHSIRKKEFIGDKTFLGTASYLDLANLERFSCDIKEAMARNFQNLNSMILNGSLLGINQIEKYQLAGNLSMNDKLIKKEVSMLRAEDFINVNKRVAYIRTRNINGSIVHNTNPDKLRFLVETLLSIGWAVLNTGTPTIELQIENSKYLEVHHSWPIGYQFYLASRCQARVMSAEAGLFVAWAATELPLIVLGEEWSVTNLESQISLLSSRKSIGIKDERLKLDFSKDDILDIFNHWA